MWAVRRSRKCLMFQEVTYTIRYSLGVDLHLFKCSIVLETTLICSVSVPKGSFKAKRVCLPGYRVEDFVFEKIEKKKPNRMVNLEYLGQDMIDAGNDYGPGTPYGKSQSNLVVMVDPLKSRTVA